MVMGPAERWLRATNPTPDIYGVNSVVLNLLSGALDNFDEWSFLLAEKRGLLPDVWSEAIEAAEELGL